MAKKKATPRGNSKSEAIRAVLASEPKAPTKEIKEKLQAKGVKASEALINKVKYDRKRLPGSKSRAARRPAAGASKADAIRDMFHKLGHDSRPRDIIAALKAKGIVVTSAQVSTLRSKLSANGSVSRASGAVAYEHLLAAKQLAERLGGVDEARRALDSFARLIGA